jgi:N-methylhydantoinase A/oxoprolinase/acetone carboxylase beta subunit
VLRPLAAVEGRLASWLDEMGEEAAAAVVAAGHRREEVAIRRRMVGLRFTGQDSVITVEHEPDTPVGASFARRFRELYGYRPEERPVEVESLRVVASVRPPARPPAPPEPPPRRAVSAGERRAHLGGDWRVVPVFERESLAPGAVFAGPALVVERHSSTVVPPRWGGRLDGAGALVLEPPGPEPLRGPSL